MPVAVAPIHGQVWATTLEFLANRRDQGEVLRVDRTRATKMVVVLGHLEHSLTRHVATTEHILEKRHHIVGAIGPSERNEQHRIVLRRLRCGRVLRVCHRSLGIFAKESVRRIAVTDRPCRNDPTGIRTPVTAVKGQCPNH